MPWNGAVSYAAAYTNGAADGASSDGDTTSDHKGLSARIFVHPFRSGGSLCGSKIADAQAAYESAATLQPTILGGVNFVLHAAGWLEGGLTVGYEKFILDADQCGMMGVFVDGVDMSENGQALDAIRANEPGTHFLGSAHTLANFETAFYRSNIADNNSFEQWEIEGSHDAAMRANAIWKQTLAEYEPPPIDEAKDEELREWIERKKASFPVCATATS
jgi:trimethylamine--corrinoid protein Co-methyltransferase